MPISEVGTARRSDRVSRILERLLDCLNTSAQQNIVALPKRQYITTGTIVYDCEEAVISLRSLSLGSPTFEFDPHGCDISTAPRMVGVTVAIVRCLQVVTDSGSAIPAAKMTQKTLDYTRDGWVLMDMLGCSGIQAGIAEVSFEGPDAGMVATTIDFDVAV